MNMFRIGVVVLFTVTTFAAPANAGVLCKKKSGALFQRDTECRRGEKPVGPTDLGFDISARLVKTITTTVPHDVETPVSFDTEVWDTADLHAPNESCLEPPIAGKYLIFGQVVWDENEVGIRQLIIRRNFVTILATVRTLPMPAHTTPMVIATHYQLELGDCVELAVVQKSGGPLGFAITGPTESVHFGMVKLP